MSIIGRIGKAGIALGLPKNTYVHAGTTDGCAAFLATGAHQIGDAVTSLGSTLVLKIASNHPVNAPQFGIYSHRVGNLWLAGGASNTGGAVIRHLFDDAQLEDLTRKINADRPTGLDYYPLLKPGERFPISDPNYAPRLEPRPADDAIFFQGFSRGSRQSKNLAIVNWQISVRRNCAACGRLAAARAICAWREIRQRKLGVPFLATTFRGCRRRGGDHGHKRTKPVIMKMPPTVTLNELSALYDVFFIDQFGVLRDGEAAYAGAPLALARLKAQGKTIVILSNSGRSGGYNAARLMRLGFDSGSFDHFVTSGDVALALLESAACTSRKPNIPVA